MMVRTFKEDSIPESVSQAEIDADWCVNIGKFPGDSGCNYNLLHRLMKMPRTQSGHLNIFETTVIAYRTPEEFVCHHQNLLIISFIAAKMWCKLQTSKKILACDIKWFKSITIVLSLSGERRTDKAYVRNSSL